MRKQFFDMPFETVLLARSISTVLLLALCSMLLAPRFPAQAQQAKKVWRIGVLSGGYGAQIALAALRQGLRELGYIEGQNIVIEYRFSEGKHERLPDLAAELVRLKVDVIYACCPGGRTSEAARKVTTTIPIVFVRSGDAVVPGGVASLARPDENVTGLSGFAELRGKRLELLKEVVPKIARVAVLVNPAIHAAALREFEPTAKGLGVQLQPLEVQTPSDLDNAFSAMAKGRVDALAVWGAPIFINHRKKISDFAAKIRVASVFDQKEFVEAGGLMSYGINAADLHHRSATYVDRILKGTKPADLPVERPTKFELVINLKTAKTLELKIPAHLLMEAAAVIE